MIVKFRKNNKASYKKDGRWIDIVPDGRYKLISVNNSLAKLVSIDGNLEIEMNIIDLIYWLEEPIDTYRPTPMYITVYFNETGTTTVELKTDKGKKALPGVSKNAAAVLGSVLNIDVFFYFKRTVIESASSNFDKSEEYKNAVAKYKANV